MSEKTYYERNRDAILNRGKDYSENNKELLRKRAKNKYREMSEEKNIKREYGRNRYHNMSEKKKQRLIMRLKNIFHSASMNFVER